MESKLSSPKRENETQKSAKRGRETPKSSSRSSNRSDRSTNKVKAPSSVKSSSRNSRRSTKSSSAKKDTSPGSKQSPSRSSQQGPIGDADSPEHGAGERALYLSTGVEADGNNLDVIETVLNANRIGNKPMEEDHITLALSQEEDEGWDTDLEDTNPYLRNLDNENERSRIIYNRACIKFGIIPSSSFLRGLKRGYVNLSNQGLGPVEVHAVALSLVMDSRVTEVTVSGNNIGSAGIKHLMDMLKENHKITSVDVSDNDLQSYGAQMIGSMLQENDTLLSLKAKGNKFRETDAKWFANAMNVYRTNLRELDLSHNELGPVGGQLLGPAIASNESLEILNLSWNHLKKSGIKAIALGLAENTSIKRLNVSWNGIEDDGAVYLADAITASEAVEKLNLSCNRISIEGVGRLISAFAPNKTLKTLKLSGNPVTVAGPVVALKMIRSHPEIGLQVLEFKDMCVSSEVNKIIQRIVRRKPNFELKHAGFTNGQDDLNAAIKKREKDVLNDPFVFLINYVQEHKLKWRELFNRLDTDKNFSISREEFYDGMKKNGIPLTKKQVNDLIDRLDTDENGEIDFGELLEGQTKYQKRLDKILGEARQRTSMSLQGSRPQSRLDSRPSSKMEVVLENTLKLQSNRVHNPNPRFEAELEDIKMSFHIPTVHMKAAA